MSKEMKMAEQRELLISAIQMAKNISRVQCLQKGGDPRDHWCSILLGELNRITEENAALRDQLYSLFERVSGCEVSEFSSEQVNYLADMIEGQLDANEGCINKVKSENAALREELRLKEAECEALAGG